MLFLSSYLKYYNKNNKKNASVHPVPNNRADVAFGVKNVSSPPCSKNPNPNVVDYCKGNSGLNRIKFMITTSYSTNATNPPQPIIGDKGEVCTETFLMVGPFDTKDMQLNCKKFLETKFFRILLYFGKGIMQVSKEVFRFIPLLDFS